MGFAEYLHQLANAGPVQFPPEMPLDPSQVEVRRTPHYMTPWEEAQQLPGRGLNYGVRLLRSGLGLWPAQGLLGTGPMALPAVPLPDVWPEDFRDNWVGPDTVRPGAYPLDYYDPLPPLPPEFLELLRQMRQ